MASPVRQAMRQERALASASPFSSAFLQLIAATTLVLGLVAFPVTGFDGFGRGLGPLRPVPMYAYFSLLLLELQAVYWSVRLLGQERHLLRYLLRTLLFSVPATIFVVILGFTPIDVSPLLKNPWLYIGANLVLFLLFGFDAFARWHQHPGMVGEKPDAVVLSAPNDPPASTARLYAPFVLVAAECIGFMLICLLAAVTLLLLQGPQHSLQEGLTRLHLLPPQTYMLPHIPVVALPIRVGFIDQLWILDLTLAFLALVVGTVAIMYVIVLYPHAEGAAAQLGAIAREGAVQLRLSLGAGSFFLWLAASFVLVAVAEELEGFVSAAAADKTSTSLASIGDLFSPVNHLDLLGVLAATVVLGALAILLVSVAAIVTEQDIPFTAGIFQTFGAVGQKVALLSPIVVYGLAGINALAILVLKKVPEPFQIGAAQLVMIPAFVGAVAISGLGRGRRTA